MSKSFSTDVLKRGYRSLRLFSHLAQYAEATDNSALDVSTDFTLELCFRLREQVPASTSFILINKFNPTGNERAYQIFLNNTAGTYTIGSLVSQNGTADTLEYDHVTIIHQFPVGVWTHLAMSWDASAAIAAEFKFYVNGEDLGATTTQHDGGITSVHDSTAPLRIGQGNGGGYVNGDTDDVRIWNVLRSTTEIRDNAFNELVGDETNLAGYWKLNGDLFDSTANANHLTSYGTILPVFDKSGGVDV